MKYHEPWSVFVSTTTEQRKREFRNRRISSLRITCLPCQQRPREPGLLNLLRSHSLNYTIPIVHKSGAVLDRWLRWLPREEGQPAPPMQVAAPAPQSGQKEEGVGFATQRQTTPLQGLPVLSALGIVYLYYTVLYVINYMTKVHYTGFYFLKYNIQFD